MPEPDRPRTARTWEDVERMLDVDEALARMLAVFSPLAPESLPILDADGLVLAANIVACEDIPPFRNSAMDGYAVRAADTAHATAASPVRLTVCGNVAAGDVPTMRVEPGQAVRIMTGAPLPAGADAVVRFEETDELSPDRSGTPQVGADVGILHSARCGDNVRDAGEDVRRGDMVLRRGTRVHPADLGLLASLGRTVVPVHPRPRVAILSTGDEVVDLESPRAAGQIRDSNSYVLASMVRRAGGVPLLLGIARDSVDDLTGKLDGGHGADLIVTSGGVSLGDYDVVKDVLRARGQIAIWQVRMKPGKPLAFGEVGGVPLLGLPGNPVAAAISFLQFARACILRMLGRNDLAIPTITATLAAPVENRGQRRHYVRVTITQDASGEYVARPAGEQGAGILSSLARADGLLVVPEDLQSAEAGTRLPVQMIHWDLG